MTWLNEREYPEKLSSAHDILELNIFLVVYTLCACNMSNQFRFAVLDARYDNGRAWL